MHIVLRRFVTSDDTFFISHSGTATNSVTPAFTAAKRVSASLTWHWPWHSWNREVSPIRPFCASRRKTRFTTRATWVSLQLILKRHFYRRDADLGDDHEETIRVGPNDWRFFRVPRFLAALERLTPRRLDVDVLTQRRRRRLGPSFYTRSTSASSASGTSRTSRNQYGPNRQKIWCDVIVSPVLGHQNARSIHSWNFFVCNRSWCWWSKTI